MSKMFNPDKHESWLVNKMYRLGLGLVGKIWIRIFGSATEAFEYLQVHDIMFYKKIKHPLCGCYWLDYKLETK